MNPPDERTVQRRALGLGAFYMRGEFEQVIRKVGRPDVVDLHHQLVDQLNEWLHGEGLDEALSPREREALSQAPGTWTDQEMIDASWRREALGTILWALSQFDELPPYGVCFEGEAVTKPLSLMSSPQEFYAGTTLRSPEELLMARSVAELWHWRSRMCLLQQAEVSAADESVPRMIALAAAQAYERGLLPPLIAGDFPVWDQAYRDLSDEEYSRVTSLTVERHFALNWLCGAAENWDETPTDV